MPRTLTILAAGALYATLLAPVVSADVFSISADNLAGASCSTSTPCGTVTVTFDGGTQRINFAIAMNSGFGVFGNNGTFGFNVVGSNATVALSNFTNVNFDGSGGSGNMNGFGSYEFRVDGPGGSGAVSNLGFSVERPGNPFTGVSDVYEAPSGGTSYFALHVRNNSTGLTGFAITGTTPLAAVPEPSSVLLFGTVASVAIYLLRKRYRV